MLPFRSQPSSPLPALDILIDQAFDAPKVGPIVSLLQTERRLEELDVAIQDAQQHGAPFRTRQRLEQTFEQEMQTYQALIDQQADEDS